jgi:hypothetical protein
MKDKLGREIIKVGPEENYTAPTQKEMEFNLRQHLLMMLEAMQYKGSTRFMCNDTLRDLVEHEKIQFLRKLQAANAEQ